MLEETRYACFFWIAGMGYSWIQYARRGMLTRNMLG